MFSGQCGKESGSKAIEINPSGRNALLSPWLINIVRLYEPWAVV